MYKQQLEFLTGKLKEIDPELREDKIKPVLWGIENSNYSFDIAPWMNYINQEFSDCPEIVKEMKYLYSKYSSLEKSYRNYRVDSIYQNIKKGTIEKEDQVYNREILPYPGVKIQITWEIRKALEIVKEKNLKAENFQITKMNISYTELDKGHVSKIKDTKTPAILLNYEPYSGEYYQYFLIDGNHRMYKILTKKNKYINFDSLNRGIARNIKTEGPVYIFQSEEILASMHHSIFRYFYLIQLLLAQMKQYEENDKNIIELVNDPQSRYQQVKKFVEELDAAGK